MGRDTTRSKERPDGSTWKSSLYWTLMMLQGPEDQEYHDRYCDDQYNDKSVKDLQGLLVVAKAPSLSPIINACNFRMIIFTNF